jgi:maleate isomerase
VDAVPDTLAHRKIFGVLVADTNTVVQPELDDLRPAGVSNQTARFGFGNVLEALSAAAGQLVACRPDAVLIALSTEFLPDGLAFMQLAADQVAQRAGVPVVTAPTATQAALRRVGARRVGVVTPFDAEANGHVRAAFETEGFAVVSIEGLACPTLDAIARSSLDDIRRAFQAVDRPEADALVHVGGGLPVVHLVDELERRFAKPVVACNAALYWAALRAAGIEDRVPGFGRLLAEC